MPLTHIEHYLIAADDMDRTRDWYRDVLGMQEGWHPDFGFPVYWMYLEGVDVVHIGKSAKHASDNQKAYLGRLAQDAGAGTGAIDHIAFRAKGLRETMKHLLAAGEPAMKQVRKLSAEAHADRAGFAAGLLDEREIRYLPPIPDADKFLCAGKNYRTHLEELKRNELLTE